MLPEDDTPLRRDSSSHRGWASEIEVLIEPGMALAVLVAAGVFTGYWDWLALPVVVALVWLIMVLFGAGGPFEKRRP
jgi:hypothetical protein